MKLTKDEKDFFGQVASHMVRNNVPLSEENVIGVMRALIERQKQLFADPKFKAAIIKELYIQARG